MIHRFLRIALEILFPPLCASCGTYLDVTQSPVCASCTRAIVKNTALLCPICGIRLANNKRSCTHDRRAAMQFPYMFGTATTYADPIIRTCIHQCKYEHVHALAPLLAQLLVDYVAALDPQPALLATRPTVIPIPLHSRKQRKRGFNQSALIAQTFAHALRLPYEESLVKLVDNDPQAQAKTHAARFDRMRGVFAVPRPATVRGKTIILIDDVSTSGATFSEAAQTLKAAGVKRILALAVAKA